MHGKASKVYEKKAFIFHFFSLLFPLCSRSAKSNLAVLVYAGTRKNFFPQSGLWKRAYQV
jgi:hypothetical protein